MVDWKTSKDVRRRREKKEAARTKTHDDGGFLDLYGLESG